MLAFFLVLVIVWCAALTPLEAILGIPLFIGGGPPAPSSLRDALWHLLTTFLLVLPTRDRRAFALAPLFSLGLDIDHIFGAYLPGPFSRMAHDLFFIAGAAAVLIVL
ncbi:MAG TPA: hypothetical protein VJS68_01560, partial [Thermoplasmata archaeon]|nr:hypothetical protein [Thermoplasmata archaeon]